MSACRRRGGAGSRGGGRRRGLVIALAAVLAEMAALWLRAHRLAGRVVVRCRSGHMFTTLWVPGVSLKSIKLGWWRFQRCPVGTRWSWVTSVTVTSLSEAERRSAPHRDIDIP